MSTLGTGFWCGGWFDMLALVLNRYPYITSFSMSLIEYSQ